MDARFFNIIPGGEEVTILLYGDVGDGQRVESGRVVGELLSLSAQYSRIAVRINSVGGDVFSGIAIYNALRTSTADITIYVDGVAASIAAIIALCGKPLYMSPYAKLMLHSVSGGTWGNASALRRTADAMESMQADLASMIAGRCGLEAEEVAARYFDGSDHWIDAAEAVEMRLADGIYELADGPETAPATTEEIYTFFNNRLGNRPQKQQQEMGLIETIKGLPTFDDKADEAAVVEHIRTLTNKAARADALEQANAGYKKRIAALEDKEAAAILDRAVADGKITEEQKPAFAALMKSDRAHTEAALEGMKPRTALRAVSVIRTDGKGGSGFADKDWDEIDRENRLAELRDTDPSLFKAKYKEKFGIEYKEY